MIPSRWKSRIDRAAELEKQYPAAAEILRFYQEIARFQSAIKSPTAFDGEDLAQLLVLVEREGPPALADAARSTQKKCGRLLISQAKLEDVPAPMQTFFRRVLRQPYAERSAAQARFSTGPTRNTCPFCSERPVVASLRPEGEGGKRGLVCPLCFTEWEFRRLLCPNCGEEDHRKLPIYKAEEFPHLRAEACDSCRHYIKAVDLTINGLAVPEVDELAAVSIDLWAVENGYIKLQANILGL